MDENKNIDLKTKYLSSEREDELIKEIIYLEKEHRYDESNEDQQVIIAELRKIIEEQAEQVHVN